MSGERVDELTAWRTQQQYVSKETPGIRLHQVRFPLTRRIPLVSWGGLVIFLPLRLGVLRLRGYGTPGGKASTQGVFEGCSPEQFAGFTMRIKRQRAY